MALEFRRQDLRGVGDFWYDTPSLGDGVCFLGLGRLLGVGIAYVTIFENFASFLFGVGAVSFIFRRHTKYKRDAAAKYKADCSNVKQKIDKILKTGNIRDPNAQDPNQA